MPGAAATPASDSCSQAAALAAAEDRRTRCSMMRCSSSVKVRSSRLWNRLSVLRQQQAGAAVCDRPQAQSGGVGLNAAAAEVWGRAGACRAIGSSVKHPAQALQCLGPVQAASPLGLDGLRALHKHFAQTAGLCGVRVLGIAGLVAPRPRQGLPGSSHIRRAPLGSAGRHPRCWQCRAMRSSAHRLAGCRQLSKCAMRGGPAAKPADRVLYYVRTSHSTHLDRPVATHGAVGSAPVTNSPQHGPERSPCPPSASPGWP